MLNQYSDKVEKLIKYENNRILIPIYAVLANIASFLVSFLVWLIPWM